MVPISTLESQSLGAPTTGKPFTQIAFETPLDPEPPQIRNLLPAGGAAFCGAEVSEHAVRCARLLGALGVVPLGSWRLGFRGFEIQVPMARKTTATDYNSRRIPE